MKQRKLLSIGALSKQTGVHVKSLRYYDRIGVLPPAYVDPESGYRYYAFSQIQLVEAIQLCVDLDIPLKEFQNFMTDDTHEIRYAKLIAHGTSIANQKMNAIREKLFFLEKMQENIERAERCRGSDTPIRCTMPEKLCFTRPRQGEQTEEELDQAFGHMMGEVVDRGWKVGLEIGLLLCCKKGESSQFLFVDVDGSKAGDAAWDQLLRLPAAEYLCVKREQSNIETAPEVFPALFRRDDDKLIIEAELHTGNYPYCKPLYELRCSLSL